MTRKIQGLRWAELCVEGPGFGRSRPRGAKAKGLAYERELGKALSAAMHGQWIEFEDANGHGWAQPDFILLGKDSLLVLEAKLSWTEEGHRQLDDLYLPLCRRLFGKPAYGVEVTKSLRGLASGIAVARDLGEALAKVRAGNKTVLHWLGSGPLIVNSRPRTTGAALPRCA